MKAIHTSPLGTNVKTIVKSKRIEWVDVAKGIFMFFVILSHSGYVPLLYKSIYSPFFLSGFFLLSGFLLFNKFENTDPIQKLVNILTSILLPYIIYWILSYSVEHIIKGDFNFLMRLFCNIVDGRKLWFVSALFVSEIITMLYLFLVKRIPKNTKEYQRICIYIYPLISLLIYFVLPEIDYVWYFKASFLASFYLGLGIILKTHSSVFLSVLENNRIGVISLLLFIGCIALDMFCLEQKGAFHVGFNNMPFFLVESIIAIYSILFLCTKITRYNSLFIFMGQSSLLFYFFQNQILHITKLFGAKLSIDNPSYWYSILTVFMVVAILYIPIKLTQRFIPILAGKYRIRLNKDI